MAFCINTRQANGLLFIQRKKNYLQKVQMPICSFGWISQKSNTGSFELITLVLVSDEDAMVLSFQLNPLQLSLHSCNSNLSQGKKKPRSNWYKWYSTIA